MTELYTVWMQFGSWDFWVYVHAAQNVLAGRNPFIPSPDDTLILDGVATMLPFFNPLPAVLPFLLFAPLPHDLAEFIWISLDIICLVIIARSSVRLAGLSLKYWHWPILLYACSQIDNSALITGQPTILISATVVMVLLSKRYGAILPFILIKPHLTLLVFGVMLWRIPKLRRPAILSFIVCVIITFILRPSWLAEYIGSLSNQPTDLTVWSTTSFLNWCKGVLGITGIFEYALYGLLLCGGAYVLWQFRNADTVVLVGVTLALTILCVPYSRAYDWPLLTLPIVLTVFRLRYRPQWIVASAIILQLLYMVDQNGSRSTTFAVGWPIAALICITFLAIFTADKFRQIHNPLSESLKAV